MSTEQELNEYLAEEIMGWDTKNLPMMYQGDTEPQCYNKFWVDKEGYQQYHIESWNPLKNLEQAFEVLEEYCEEYRLRRSDIEPNYICYLIEWTSDEKEHRADTKTKAIIGAILKAEGKFEEFEEVLE